jgi:hypothetical protein
MKSTDGGESAGESRAEAYAHRVRVPGFLVEDEVGLGDVIARATSRFGISPCKRCEERRIALNRWMQLRGAHKN